LLAGTILISGAACVKKMGENDSQNNQSNAADGKNKEQVELTLWHIWPSGPINEIVNKYVKQYEKENNVKIRVDATQGDEYQQRKLKVAIASGVQGDVFFSYGAGYSQPFIKAGAVLPLDNYLKQDNTKDRLLEGVLNYLTYDGVVYGLPLKSWVGALFCNIELFEKNGVDYPETWEQLMYAVKTFRQKGITPMVLGAKDAWHIGMIQNILAIRTAGVDYCNNALSGKATFDTPEISKSAQMLVDLNREGAFIKGTLGVSADEAQIEFFSGNVPMYFAGSWIASDCESEENQIKGKVKVMPFPEIDGGKGNKNTYSGGAIDCYMVNSKTKFPDEAVKFAIKLTEYQCVESYKIGDSIPTWKLNIDESQVNPVLRSINKLTQNASGYVLAWDTLLEGMAIDAYYNLLQRLIGKILHLNNFQKKCKTSLKNKKTTNENLLYLQIIVLSMRDNKIYYLACITNCLTK